MSAEKAPTRNKPGRRRTQEKVFTVRGFRISDEAHRRLTKFADKESLRIGLPVSNTKALERLILRTLTEDGDFDPPKDGLFPE